MIPIDTIVWTDISRKEHLYRLELVHKKGKTKIMTEVVLTENPLPLLQTLPQFLEIHPDNQSIFQMSDYGRKLKS